MSKSNDSDYFLSFDKIKGFAVGVIVTFAVLHFVGPNSPTSAFFWELKEKHNLYTLDEVVSGEAEDDGGQSWISVDNFPGNEVVMLEVDTDTLDGQAHIAEKDFKPIKEDKEGVTYGGWIYSAVVIDSSYHEFTISNR